MTIDGDHQIHFEEIEDGVYGIVATAGDVQVGWCRKQGRIWLLFNMDEEQLVDGFNEFNIAKAEALRLFKHLAGASNPGH